MPMSAQFPHLTTEAAKVALMSDEDRLNYLKVFKWIPYDQATKVLNRLESLTTEPPHTRMPCVLIYGPTDNGKSRLIEKFNRTHGLDPNPGGDRIIVDAVTIEASSTADEAALLNDILLFLNAPFREKTHKSIKEAQIATLFEKLGIKLLIIDEFHAIAGSSMTKRAIYLNAIKRLTNRLKIPIVLIGTHLTLLILRENLQVFNRFQPIALPEWKDGTEFRTLLASFEATLPLQQPSGLGSNVEMVNLILMKSGGILGEISKLLVMAATEAIQAKEEYISLDRLKKLDYTPADKARAELFKNECDKIQALAPSSQTSGR